MRLFSNRHRLGTLLVLVALAVPAFAPVQASTTTSTTTKTTTKEKSLYERLGKRKAITYVVNDFTTRISADARINTFFAATFADPARLSKFKTNMVDQLCQASGGPYKYRGKDMKTAHHGMGITQANFDAMVENLTASLDKFKVSSADKTQLLGVLEPMKSDIAAEGQN